MRTPVLRGLYHFWGCSGGWYQRVSMSRVPCPRGDIFGGHRMLSTPAPGAWDGRGGQSHGRSPCHQCLPLGWGQLQRAGDLGSDLGKGRLMGTVHLTNCREREKGGQSESECVCEGKGEEGYHLKLWGSLI